MGRQSNVVLGQSEGCAVSARKTMQAKVDVACQMNPFDTVCRPEKEPVGRSVLLSWMPDSASRPIQCGDSICFYAKISRPVSLEN